MTKILHGGAIARAIEIYGGRKEDWLDLSTGINPNPPALPPIPPEIWNRLPDMDLEIAARKAAARWYLEVDHCPANLWPVAVAGTQAFIEAMPRLWPAARRAAIVYPTYGEYANCLSRAGFEVDLVSSPDEIGDGHDLAIVVNPNNPDGRHWRRADLLSLAQRLASRGAHLHVDEAFADMSSGNSLALAACDNPFLTVSRSFGKFFGMAGARLGFVFAEDALKRRLVEIMGPWPVSGPALYLAANLMQAGSREIANKIAERGQSLRKLLTEAGLAIAGHAELIVLVEQQDANSLFEHLARNRILVRKFDYAPSWLRFGLPPDDEGDDRLRAALSCRPITRS